MQEQQLYGLMAVVEDQQKTMQETLAGLAAERAALRQDLAEMRRAMQAIVPALQEAVGAGAAEAMTATLSDASKIALRSFDEATRPAVTGLANATRAASDAQQELQNAVQWFSWKWVSLVAACLGALCLAAYASTWSTRNHAENLQFEVNRLQVEANQLQQTVAALESRGGRAVVQQCGTRLCFELAKDQGGGWKNKATGGTLAIPMGY